MPDLRNVIVFAIAGARYAAELRWVREVITLGFVTEIPTAPPGLSGSQPARHEVVPSCFSSAARPAAAPATPRQGDGALLLEADHALGALRVDTIDEVGTLPAGPGNATVIDARGRMVAVVDPPTLVRRAAAAAWAVRGIPAPSDDIDDPMPWSEPGAERETLGYPAPRRRRLRAYELERCAVLPREAPSARAGTRARSRRVRHRLDYAVADICG